MQTRAWIDLDLNIISGRLRAYLKERKRSLQGVRSQGLKEIHGGIGPDRQHLL